MNRINIEYTVCQRISLMFPEKEESSPRSTYRTTNTEVDIEHGPSKGKTEPIPKNIASGVCKDAATPRILNLNPANPVCKAAGLVESSGPTPNLCVRSANHPIKQLNVTDKIQTCSVVFPLLIFQAST